MQSALPGYGAYRLGELFCGAGGMALGASQAEYRGQMFEHVWATDIDVRTAIGRFSLVDVGTPGRVTRGGPWSIGVEAKLGRDEAFNGDDLGDQAGFLKTLSCV